jgi:RimJ/RimL family protein N-acetyltransferase
MTELRFGEDVGQWIARELETTYALTDTQAIGLARNGRMVGGVMYEDWNGRSVVAHMAIRERVTPEFWWVVADYPFRQIGASKVIAPIHSANYPMMRLADHLGFRQEARIENAHPLGDILIYTLIERDCRIFQREQYGKRVATACA